MILMENVIKRYGETLALDHLNMEVDKGQIIGLLGPNGAGKTTTIKALIGLTPIDDGRIEVFGIEQDGKNRDIRRRLGLVTQEVTIYEDLTTRENLMFFGSLYGLDKDVLVKRLQEVAELIGLEKHLHARPKTFSGGMKRRLNIGCALLHDPELLIMDEPTVGIDPQSRNHILEFVRRIAKAGTTILYTSHYIEEVQAISDRVLIMDQGHIIAQGTTRELIRTLQNEKHVFIDVDITSDETKKKLEALADVKQVLIVDQNYHVVLHPGVHKFDKVLDLVRSDGINGVTTKEPNLEDVFLVLTGKKLRDGEAV
ncbi:MAG: ABC transporter ATP-binding protein [Acholeplasmataceae bacterium]